MQIQLLSQFVVCCGELQTQIDQGTLVALSKYQKSEARNIQNPDFKRSGTVGI